MKRNHICAIVCYSVIPISSMELFSFLIYEKGGSVGHVKQLIKLTWPYTQLAITFAN